MRDFKPRLFRGMSWLKNTLLATWPRYSDWLWVLSIFLVGLGARLGLIERFGTPLPFWDQWDEVRVVFVPYFQGKLSLPALFSPHNEHRILFTRLYDLALLLLNGQWDNLVQMTANAFIYTAVVAGFGWQMARLIGRQFWPMIGTPPDGGSGLALRLGKHTLRLSVPGLLHGAFLPRDDLVGGLP